MAEVEESNDAFRLRKVRLNRGIRRMRLERAYLLETLGKRMRKNGSSMDGIQSYYDEDSEGSSEGPPTIVAVFGNDLKHGVDGQLIVSSFQPNDRPLRTKRRHRRAASPPSTIGYQMSQHQSYAVPSGYEQTPHGQHSSPYAGPPPNVLPHPHQYPHPQHVPMHQLQIVPHPPQHQHQPQLNPMLSPIPAPSAFAMFFENNYLSQPHKHSGARTEEDLLELARRNWTSEEPAHIQVRKMYEAEEQKQRQRYADSNQRLDSVQGHGRIIPPKVEQDESAFEAVKDRADAERGGRDQREPRGGNTEALEMGNAARGAGSARGGFTSING
ncbi:MAG: hypothetical protein Q9163_000710 [Psora crenata]